MADVEPPQEAWKVKAYYFASFTFFAASRIAHALESLDESGELSGFGLHCKASYERYATLYFESDGFSASEIGLLIAGRRLLQTISTPWWNGLADRSKKARSIQMASLALGAVPFVALSIPVHHDAAGELAARPC